MEDIRVLFKASPVTVGQHTLVVLADSYDEAFQFIRTKRKTSIYYDDVYTKSPLFVNMSQRIQQLERQIKLLNSKLNGDNLDASTSKEGNKEDKKPYILQTSLILPPEYDPNSSKWTLKYPQNGPELTELIHGSGVYVNTKSLEICLQKSKNCYELAKNLLPEIFSANALNVCLFNGRNRPTATETANNLIRPLLNRKATDVLLNFVVKYGEKSKWVTKRNSIKSSLTYHCKKKFDQ